MKKIILLFLSLCFACSAFAQTFSVSGRVVDVSSGEAVPFAGVAVRNTLKGVNTNTDGTFMLKNLKKGTYELEITALGYADAVVSVTVENNVTGVAVGLEVQTEQMEEVVVTATRTERVLLDVPIATQVISGPALEKMQVSTFRDVLEYELPGVEFTNNGGYANINMLGFGGKYVLFLVDGERMAGESFDNIDYNRIDMDNIERVEIVKGASSSLYGSNAVGGVVNLITRKPKEPLQVQTGFRYGSFNELNGNLSVSTRQKWGSASVSGSYKQMSPYLLKDTEPITEIFPDGSQVQQPLSETMVAGYTDFSITPKLSFDLTDGMTLEAKGGYYFKERNPGGIDGTKVRDRFYDYTGGLRFDYAISEDQHLSISGNYDRYEKYEFYKLLSEREKEYENSQWRIGLLYDILIKGKHSVVAGAEYFSDDLLTFMFDSEGEPDRRDAYTASVFTQQDWLLHKKLTLVTGLRYDYHSQFKGHLTPRVALMYRPLQKLTVRGGYSGGFRSPTLKELYTNWFHPYGGGFQIIGNKDMKAEISNNFNMSVEARPGKTVLTAMAQYSLIKNKISSVWLDKDTIQYRNMGDARILSLEFTVSQSIGKDLSLKGTYAYVKDNLGKQSTTRPHTATFRLDYTASFIHRRYAPTVSLSGKYFGPMYIYGSATADEDDDSGVNVPVEGSYKVFYEGYMIWRLSINIPLPYNLSINAGINNLFGYKPKFSSFYSSISPGRTFYVGLKWRLK